MDSKIKNELRQPHDKLFFHTLKNKNIARDVLRSYLPEELLAESDLNEIKLYKTKLVSPFKSFCPSCFR